MPVILRVKGYKFWFFEADLDEPPHIHAGKENNVKAKIRGYGQNPSVVPLLIPDLEEVGAFASKLHAQSKPWKGEAFGWQAEYNPEKSQSPLDSNMTFTPADFCIGESGIWFFSMMWEHGKTEKAVEFLDERNIVK